MEERIGSETEWRRRKKERAWAGKRVNPLGSPQPPGVILLDDKTGVRGQVLLTPLISSALHAAEYRAQKRELSKYPGWLRPPRRGKNGDRYPLRVISTVKFSLFSFSFVVSNRFLSNISPVCTCYLHSCRVYIREAASRNRNSKDLHLCWWKEYMDESIKFDKIV